MAGEGAHSGVQGMPARRSLSTSSLHRPGTPLTPRRMASYASTPWASPCTERPEQASQSSSAGALLRALTPRGACAGGGLSPRAGCTGGGLSPRGGCSGGGLFRSSSVNSLCTTARGAGSRSPSVGALCATVVARRSSGAAPRGGAPGPKRCAALLTMARRSREALQRELLGLEGVQAEVTSRLEELDEALCRTPSGQSPSAFSATCGQSPSTLSTTCGSLTHRSWGASTAASCPSQCSRGPPGPVEQSSTTEGQWASFEGGAQPDPADLRQTCQQALLELQEAAKRCRWAIDHLELLVEKLDSVASGHVPGGPPRGACAALLGQGELEQSAGRTARLTRQLQERIEENRSLCSGCCEVIAAVVRRTGHLARRVPGTGEKAGYSGAATPRAAAEGAKRTLGFAWD